MRITGRYTFWLVVVLTIVMVGLRFAKPFDHAISWDVKGYYLYLPAAFIYHDPLIEQIDWVHDIREKYGTAATLYMLNPTDRGTHVIKYTMGLSWLYAPMFFTGHALAAVAPQWPADGFSAPYRYVLSLGMFLYVFGGLFFLRKILQTFFDHQTVWLVMILLVLGTNLLNQAAYHTLLAHTPLFFLMATFTWSVMRFYEELSLQQGNKAGLEALTGLTNGSLMAGGAALRWFMAIALLCGFITLIRPTEVVCFFLFLLWDVPSWKGWKDRMMFFLRRPLLVALFGALFLVMLLPQMLYWQSHTGSLLYYSYDNPGEGLDLLAPHTVDFLFSFRKGWLVYTPLMWFAMAGLVLLYRARRGVFIPVMVFFVLSLYLMSSWTTWWYAGGCFSSRTMVSVYPVLAIPLGWLVSAFLDVKNRFIKMAVGLLFVLFVFLNIFQTWQFQRGIITLETMTRDYYLRVFLRTSVQEEDRRYLLVARPLTSLEVFPDEPWYESNVLLAEGFSAGLRPGFNREQPHGADGRLMLVLDSDNQFSPVWTYAFEALTSSDHAWLRGVAYVYLPLGYEGPDPLLVMSFTHKGENYKYRSSEEAGHTLARGTINEIRLDYLSPEVRHPDDSFLFYLWHRGSESIYLDSVSLEAYTPQR